jgi:hypothetical protein
MIEFRTKFDGDWSSREETQEYFYSAFYVCIFHVLAPPTRMIHKRNKEGRKAENRLLSKSSFSLKMLNLRLGVFFKLWAKSPLLYIQDGRFGFFNLFAF